MLAWEKSAAPGVCMLHECGGRGHMAMLLRLRPHIRQRERRCCGCKTKGSSRIATGRDRGASQDSTSAARKSQLQAQQGRQGLT